MFCSFDEITPKQLKIPSMNGERRAHYATFAFQVAKHSLLAADDGFFRFFIEFIREIRTSALLSVSSDICVYYSLVRQCANVYFKQPGCAYNNH